ncbi:DedA family protein [Gordonia spumicola]|uniref:DedA family protein n=1 Tax=Gordonia spumicola TaxID=589161 RepID=UPI001E57FBB1|nr:DedA family protein [Gordonia spumicola]
MLTSWIDAAPAWAVYAITAAVLYIETAVVVIGVVVPSEGVLIAAGVVASIGSAQIGVLILVSVLAAVAGDWTGYWVGRGFGPRLSATRLGRRMTRRMIRRRRQAPSPSDAVIAVASARWIGFVRSLIPLVAGARRMPFRRFALASAIGVFSWTSTVLLISWAVGATLGADVALMVAIGVGLLSLALLIYRRTRQAA